ncbi:MAG: hypothetical protein ACI9WS_002561 [Paraglaciecola psychrophila]|jgi:hypothetical protein
MSNDRPTDPTQYFEEWIGNWERAVNGFSNKLMETDDFSKAVNSVQNTQLQMQKVFAEMMAKQLATLNMPSRSDVVEVVEAMRSLENRFEKIERQLAKISGAMEAGTKAKPKGPPRTKKAPVTAKK